MKVQCPHVWAMVQYMVGVTVRDSQRGVTHAIFWKNFVGAGISRCVSASAGVWSRSVRDTVSINLSILTLDSIAS